MTTERQEVHLPATTSAPRAAREFVGLVLTEWRLDHLKDTALLLTSEVVTNAVVHAGTASTLRIERAGSDRVRISVLDGGAGVAQRVGDRSGAPGGHGLALVDTLAQDWGSRRVDGHHEVWFHLDNRTDLPSNSSA